MHFLDRGVAILIFNLNIMGAIFGQSGTARISVTPTIEVQGLPPTLGFGPWHLPAILKGSRWAPQIIKHGNVTLEQALQCHD